MVHGLSSRPKRLTPRENPQDYRHPGRCCRSFHPRLGMWIPTIDAIGPTLPDAGSTLRYCTLRGKRGEAPEWSISALENKSYLKTRPAGIHWRYRSPRDKPDAYTEKTSAPNRRKATPDPRRADVRGDGAPFRLPGAPSKSKPLPLAIRRDTFRLETSRRASPSPSTSCRSSRC